MSEFEYDFSDESSLDSDQRHIGNTEQEWLKISQKGQTVRCAFLYFYTVDAEAVRLASKSRKLSREEVIATAKGALEERAKLLNKTVDQLTPEEKLDTRTTHFKVNRYFYHNDTGYVMSRLGKDGPEADAVWRRLGDEKITFSTVVIEYPIDEDGNIDKERFGQQLRSGKLKILPYRFSKQTYDGLYKQVESLRSNNLSLATQDIKLECTDTKYKKVVPSSQGAATWLKNEQVKKTVLTAAVQLYPKLTPFRELTTEQVMSKLGMGGGSRSGGSGGGADDLTSEAFQDMLDGV